MGQCESTNGGVLNAAPVPDGIDHFVEYNGAGPWFNCEPNAEVAPRMAKRGPAGPDTKPQTFMDLMEKAVANHGDKPALLVERPLPLIGADKKVPPPLPREQWTTWTWKEFRDDSKRSAKAFISLGMQPHESINIWGFNAPEWLIGCVAAMYAGGKCAGLYPTDTAETVAYKVVHSGGSIVISDDRSKIDKIAKALSERKDCTRLKAFVLYSVDVPTGQKVEVAGLGSIPIISWQEMLKMGDKGSDTDLSKRLSSTKPGHCAALIYTSGTTGEPKAVMISHDNFIFEAVTVLNHLGKSCGFAMAAGEERCLSYLPLSHVAGMLLDIVAPVTATAFKPASYTVFFARPYDLKEKAIKDRLGIAKPTVFLGVPLVWEKIADQIRSMGAAASPTQQTVAGMAKGLALEYALNTQLGGSGQVPWGYSVAKSVVLSKIRARLGLDECKAGLTGAAPIRVDTLEYFGSLGLNINEAYGMSECTGACTLSSEQAHQWGSCGFELPGVEVKAFLCEPADFNKKQECPRAPSITDNEEQYQGELCFRGRNIMMGYLACPEMGKEHVAEMNKKTAEAIDGEGWLHSGDKGMITMQGMVKITGRYKELIIGEGGENIAPVPIEDEVKKGCDGIAEVMMVGDRRKYNVALVTLKAVGANGEVPGTDDLDAGASRVNPSVSKISEAMDDKLWIDIITAAITAANKNGKCCPNAAFKIQKFTILPTNFSEEAGELTPTKKLKRKIVENAYAKLIDKIYAEEGVYIKYTAD
mmetsp:Transcript_116086/g.369346  ORF Transcript_116086/g.369346 Transcript_116086/m.369346 type:complete len:756 (-) Transcript_116086:113-2380(-)